jgi:hypothetical protein
MGGKLDNTKKKGTGNNINTKNYSKGNTIEKTTFYYVVPIFVLFPEISFHWGMLFVYIMVNMSMFTTGLSKKNRKFSCQYFI